MLANRDDNWGNLSVLRLIMCLKHGMITSYKGG